MNFKGRNPAVWSVIQDIVSLIKFKKTEKGIWDS